VKERQDIFRYRRCQKSLNLSPQENRACVQVAYFKWSREKDKKVGERKMGIEEKLIPGYVLESGNKHWATGLALMRTLWGAEQSALWNCSAKGWLRGTFKYWLSHSVKWDFPIACGVLLTFISDTAHGGVLDGNVNTLNTVCQRDSKKARGILHSWGEMLFCFMCTFFCCIDWDEEVDWEDMNHLILKFTKHGYC
jgi:hypothetical protein